MRSSDAPELGGETGPISCERCGICLAVNGVSKQEYRSLYNQHSCGQFIEEFQELQRIHTYFERHPNEDRKKPTTVQSDEDALVVEYLRTHSFSLYPRLKFVTERIAELSDSATEVSCPHCKVGNLRVTEDDWRQFNADYFSRTWYQPRQHFFDKKNVLHIKSSGWEGDMHGLVIFSVDIAP